MLNRKIIMTAYSAAGVAALLMTAGCSGGSTGGTTTSGSPAASAETSVSSTADPTSSGSASGAASDPGATTDPAGDAAPADTPQGDTELGDTEEGVARCLSPDLAGSVVAAEGGGSAGHTELSIELKNEAAEPCILQGWPGVSFVGGDNGTQIGAAATLDRASAHDTVTLKPGATAHASLSVANAENFDEDCDQTPADGFRVYPPGETRSIFVRNDQLTLTACANADDELLDVQAFQPGA